MKIHCSICGRLVADIMPGSQIRRGTDWTCRECGKPSTGSDIPDFLRDLMNGKHR